MSYEGKLFVDYPGLVAIGWPYSKSQTIRLMKPFIKRSKGKKIDGTYVEEEVRNTRIFPRGMKFGDFQNSPYMWWASEVQEYFDKHFPKK